MEESIIISNKIKPILSEIEAYTKKVIGSHLIKIILYGSYARNEENEESDIDIMVLTDENQERNKYYRNFISEFKNNLILQNEILISIIYQNVTHFNWYKDVMPFYTNITKEGKVIYGAKNN